MLAWHLTDPDHGYSWGEVPDPEPGPGEVRIKVRASALNHMDIWLTKGQPKPPAYPHVPGSDTAGVIESLGEGVEGWQIGDEVVVNTAVVPARALAMGIDSVLDPEMRLLGEHRWGGHGELCVAPAHGITRKPEGRSWVDSASYPVCLTSAWRLLRRGRVAPGQTVLVTGFGSGVGTAAAMLAMHLGADVVVTSRDEGKRQRALELGAVGAVDSAGPFPRDVDIVVDSIGPAVWDDAIRSLRRGGRMCICGGTSGPVVELNLPRLFFKQLEIIGASIGSQEEFQYVTDLMAGGLRTVVDEVHPLEDYPLALERLRSGQHVGKIVLEHPV
jgi:NADPH:quinone reductase-like Zn-dependent oxidoreductase